MRTRLWNTIMKIKYSEAYAETYSTWARFCSQILNGICLLVSTTSIAGLWVWEKYPLLWGALFTIAQIYQAVKPLSMLERRRVGLKFYIPDIQRLSIKAAESWDIHNACSEAELISIVYNFENALLDLQAKYFDLDDPLPDHWWLRKIAERKRNLFCNEFINTQKEDSYGTQEDLNNTEITYAREN